MYVTAQESRALSHLFGLLAEDLAEREVRERIGHHLLELLSADYYASFVWDTPSRSFGSGVWLNMSPDNLARYDAYYQYHDPITLKLQARRRAPQLHIRRRAAPGARVLRWCEMTKQGSQMRCGRSCPGWGILAITPTRTQRPGPCATGLSAIVSAARLN